MTDKPDNPAAFPQSLSQDGPFGGMTLRDWFATHAPVTLMDAACVCGWTNEQPMDMTSDTERQTLWAVMALIRYDYADAMLTERNRHG